MTSSQEKTGGSRRLAAVWFADIVGFTRLSTENEPLALRLVEAVQAAATAAVESHGGKIVKFMGDGVMAEFASTEGAAFGGLQLLLRFDQVTEGWEQGPHRLRLGMHLGDVAVAADGDIYGEGVNRASRLEGLAEPGTFMVSEDVFRQLRNRPDLILTELGTRSIKGYDDPLPVYDAAPTDELAERLLLAAEAPEEPADTTPSPSRRPSRPIAVGIAVGVTTFAALGVWTAVGGRPTSDSPPLGAGSSSENVHMDSFSIAVLPFRYLSDDESGAYIADGISEELIHALSGVPELRVASRTSSFQYRDAEMDVAVLADRLGVLMVLEGRVQKDGDDLRITAQLIDADHGSMQIWSQAWDSKSNDVLGLQTDIAQAVVVLLDQGEDGADGISSAMAKVAVPGGGGPGSPTIDPEAHDLLLKARYELARGTASGASTAAGMVTLAIESAPEYARAHLALGEARFALGKLGARPLDEMLPRVRGHLEDALRYDPNLGQAHSVLATLLGTFMWDWEGAEREFEAALEAAPTPEVHRALAEFLSARGRHDEALAQVAMAFRLEPGAVANLAAQGSTLFRAGSYASAQVVLTEALRLSPGDDHVRIQLARTQELLGELRQASITLEGSDLENRSAEVQVWMAHLSIAAGGLERAEAD